MMVRVRHAVAPALCATMLAVPVAVWADVSVRGFFSQRFDAELGPDGSGDDSDNDQSVSSVTDLGAVISASTPRTRFTFAPGLRGFLTTRDDEDPSLLPRFNAAVARSGPRHSVTADFSFLPDFVSATDFTETGTTERDVIQFDVRASGGLTYQVDARNSVSADLFARLREFDEDTDDLTPNTSFGGGLRWSRQLDRRNAANLSLRYTQFVPLEDSDGDTSDRSQTFSLTAGLDRTVRPDFDIGFSAGLSVVDRLGSTDDDEEDPSIGFVGSLTARYDATDDTALTFGLRQSVEADSQGNPQNRTSLDLGVTNTINDRHRIGLSLRASSEADIFDSDDGGGDDDDEDYRVEISPFYSVSITRDWSARVGYALRLSDDDDGPAVNNRLFFSISRNFDFLP